MRTRLRHLALVNPSCRNFDQLADDAPVPFLPMEKVWPGGKLDLSERRPKSAVATGYTRFHSGDVLVPKITPTFEASRSVQVPSLPNAVGTGTTELHVIRAGSAIDSRYLCYIFHSRDFLRLGEAEMYGVAGQKRVPDDFIRDWMIDLPPLGEQRRIADFLDAETRRSGHLSALIMRTRATLATKRDLTVTSTLGLDEAPRMRTLKHAVRAVGVGIVITPARWYVDHGGIPAIRGMNVKRDGFDTRDLVCISHDGHRENIRSRLSAGDIVVVRTGQAGTAAVVPPSLDGCNCIDILIIRPGPRVDARYLAHYINSDFARERIAAGSVGTIQSHFNVESMKNLAFPIMDRQEQAKRAARLDDTLATLDSLDAQLDRQLTLLAERRQSLITAAVTGQFDVTTARGVDV